MAIITKSITLILFLIFTSSFALAGEIYTWTDKKGSLNITNVEPSEPVNIIGREGYKASSPYEIQRYEAYRKHRQRKIDIEEKQGRVMQDYYKSNDDYRREARNSADADENRRQKERRYQIEDDQLRRERIQARENHNYREVRRLWNKQEERDIDRRARED